MRNKILLGIAALLIGSGGALAASTPAQAAESECTSPYICLWTNANFGGYMYRWTVLQIQQQPGQCVTFSSGIDNQASSIKGMHSHAVTFFDGYGGGANFARGSAFRDANLGDTSGITGWNNRISSLCVLV